MIEEDVSKPLDKPMPEPSVILKSNKSFFHSKWMNIKEKEEPASEMKDLKGLKHMKKGKGLSLENKVSSANIKEWVTLII
jgi:hypothetical protein